MNTEQNPKDIEPAADAQAIMVRLRATLKLLRKLQVAREALRNIADYQPNIDPGDGDFEIYKDIAGVCKQIARDALKQE